MRSYKLYFLQNENGQFLKSQAYIKYGAYEKMWTPNLGRARMYSTPNGPTGQIPDIMYKHPRKETPKVVCVEINSDSITTL